MHLPFFQKLLRDKLENEKMENLVRSGALFKNISILPLVMRAKQDQI